MNDNYRALGQNILIWVYIVRLRTGLSVVGIHGQGVGVAGPAIARHRRVEVMKVSVSVYTVGYIVGN